MLVTYIISFLLFFLPLVVLPIGISPFETPKVILAEMVIELLLFLFFFGKYGAGAKELNPMLIRTLGVIFLLSLIYFPFQISQNIFFGNIFRLQGVFLLWHLVLFAALSSAVNLSRTSHLYIFSLVGLLFGALIFGTDLNDRYFGTLGEPNALAAAAIFLFPFSYFAYKLPLKAVAFVVTLLVLFLSGSRSAFLALSLQLLLLFFVQKLKLSTAKSLSICLLLFIFGLSLPFLEGGGWFENRSEIWQTAFYAGLQSPLIGQGFGNVADALHRTAQLLNNNVQFQFVDSSHNLVLDWWVQGGLIGTVLLVFVIFYSFYQFIKKRQLLELVIFLGILTTMSFNPVSVVTLIAFWWVIGQGFKPAQQS